MRAPAAIGAVVFVDGGAALVRAVLWVFECLLVGQCASVGLLLCTMLEEC